MFHVINENTLYDIIAEEKIELNLFKGKSKVDIAKFLDDVSVWMDKNRQLLTEKHLPFSVLSVGTVPPQVSAFMYGLFVGKALEKHGLKVQSSVTKVSKDIVLKEISKYNKEI